MIKTNYTNEISLKYLWESGQIIQFFRRFYLISKMLGMFTLMHRESKYLKILFLSFVVGPVHFFSERRGY